MTELHTQPELHTQTVDEFRARTTETLDRLRATGEPEVLTVEGKSEVVLLSPAAYAAMEKEALQTRDSKVMRQAMAEYRQGLARPADEVFAEIRQELLAMKAARK